VQKVATGLQRLCSGGEQKVTVVHQHIDGRRVAQGRRFGQTRPRRRGRPGAQPSGPT
jgi:hypothetical protein